jgi:hypothetical protein
MEILDELEGGPRGVYSGVSTPQQEQQQHGRLPLQFLLVAAAVLAGTSCQPAYASVGGSLCTFTDGKHVYVMDSCRVIRLQLKQVDLCSSSHTLAAPLLMCRHLATCQSTTRLT